MEYNTMFPAKWMTEPETDDELEEEVEIDEHLCCQNWPNCDEYGCGPDKDVGHRG
jgi:hypothetical protein